MMGVGVKNTKTKELGLGLRSTVNTTNFFKMKGRNPQWED